MSLDPRYILMQDIQQLFVDKDTGLPLANGTVGFYVDDDRNTLKDIFILTGAPPNYTYTPIANPVPLSLIGTPTGNSNNDVALYYYPYDANGQPELYYISVKDSAGNMQLTREAWPNQPIGGAADEVSGSTADNMISNPQFVAVNFNPSTGVTLPIGGSGTTDFAIAPGWTLSVTTSGASSVVVNQISLAGTSGFPTNPPFSLRVTPGANTSAISLVQELSGNPNIWAALSTNIQGYVASSITLGSQFSNVTMQYMPSGTGTPTTLLTGSNNTGLPLTINNTVELPPPDNTDLSTAGFTNIVIQLNTGSVTELTSVQVMGMATDVENVSYQQTPINRQLDQLAHYYIPLDEYMPIPSYLIGWDFKLNPAQIKGPNVGPLNLGNNTSFYAWDQTIVFQSITTSINVSRGASPYLNGLNILAAADGQFALIQYLDANTANELLASRMSVNIVGGTSRTDGLNGVVTLWACTDPNLPAMGSNNSLVATLAANGAPATLHGAWTKVPRGGFPDEVFTLEPAPTTGLFNAPIMLNGWDIQGGAPLGTATYFAIVIGFSAWSTGNTATFASISLCAGDIATIPAPQTAQQVLTECEQFYEYSYANYAAVATATIIGQQIAPMAVEATWGAGVASTAATTFFSNQPFNVNYRTLKRASSPTVTFYSPATGTISLLDATLNDYDGTPPSSITKQFNPATYWTASAGSKSANFVPSGNLPTTGGFDLGGAAGGSAYLLYHYLVDARFGIVN